VRNGEAGDIEITDGEAAARSEKFESGGGFAPIEEGGRTLGQVDGNTALRCFGNRGEAAGMVGMLMRDQDGVDRTNIFADSR